MLKVKINFISDPNEGIRHRFISGSGQIGSAAVDVQSVGQDLCRCRITWCSHDAWKSAEAQYLAALFVLQWPTIRIINLSVSHTVMQCLCLHNLITCSTLLWSEIHFLRVITSCKYTNDSAQMIIITIPVKSWKIHTFVYNLTLIFMLQWKNNIWMSVHRVTWSMSPIWLVT